MTQPQTVQNAIAKQESGPAALVTKYHDDFASSLPSHINEKQWIAVATRTCARPLRTIPAHS